MEEGNEMKRVRRGGWRDEDEGGDQGRSKIGIGRRKDRIGISDEEGGHLKFN